MRLSGAALLGLRGLIALLDPDEQRTKSPDHLARREPDGARQGAGGLHIADCLDVAVEQLGDKSDVDQPVDLALGQRLGLGWRCRWDGSAR